MRRRRPSAVEPPPVEVVAAEEQVGGSAARLRADGQVGRGGAGGRRRRLGPTAGCRRWLGRAGDGGRKKRLARDLRRQPARMPPQEALAPVARWSQAGRACRGSCSFCLLPLARKVACMASFADSVSQCA